MRHTLVPALLICSLAAPSFADEPSARRAVLPADLLMVPTDALGFVHVRAADIWKSEALKDVRETVLKAGQKALEGFDKRFLPHPSSIQRLTVVFLAQDPDLKKEPLFYAVLATNKDIDREAFLKSALPNAVKKDAKFGHYFADEKSRMAVAFVTDQIIAFGPVPAIDAYYSKDARADGSLAAAIQMANGRKHIVAAANISALPAKALEGAPPLAKPLLKAKSVTVAMDIAGELQFDAGLSFANADDAKAGEEALKQLAAMGRTELKKVHQEMLDKVLGDGKIAPLEKLPEATLALFALGSIERLDEFLANPPIKRDGNSLNASIKLPGGSGVIGVAAVGVGLMLPAVQKVREAAARAQSSNNLKQIAIAMHNYESTYGNLPPAAICDKKGKPLLSWRVAILPFIEQDNLYKQFKLDEPWDSEQNLPLSRTLVKVYLHPQGPPEAIEKGLSYYRLFTGDDTPFGLIKGKRLLDITDGTSNTFMVVEAEEGVPWTKPDDFEYGAKKPLPKFGKFSAGGFNAAFCDGSVRFISNSTPDKTLRALITANGGEVFELP
jgi:prepilin-type processing-associated H-X9-DG protein